MTIINQRTEKERDSRVVDLPLFSQRFAPLLVFKFLFLSFFFFFYYLVRGGKKNAALRNRC